MRRGFAWALALLILPGCLQEKGPSVPVTEGDVQLPPGWQTGVRLTPFWDEGTHSGSHTVRLNATGLDRPASCLAVRGNTSHAEDACTVRDPHEWERTAGAGRVEYPWVAEARWVSASKIGSGPETWQYRVAALDVDGRVVGWWDGASSPWTVHVTE